MNPMRPDTTLLVKLGSIAIHVDEMLSTKGHPFDRGVLEALLNDEEVKEWIRLMDTLALIPKKR